jgi:hypothetical protein
LVTVRWALVTVRWAMVTDRWVLAKVSVTGMLARVRLVTVRARVK